MEKIEMTVAEFEQSMVAAFRLCECLLRKCHEPVFSISEIKQEISGLMLQARGKSENLYRKCLQSNSECV